MGYESYSISEAVRKLEGEIQGGPVITSPENARFAASSPSPIKMTKFLTVTLVSIKKVILSHLGLNDLEYMFTDNVKQQWKLKKQVSYPRSYILFGGIEILKDRQNNMAARTGGYAAVKAAQGRAGNAVAVSSVFPIRVSFEYHYFDNDEARLIEMVEKMALMCAAGTASYQITIRGSHLHQAKLQFDSSIEIPQLDLSLDINPESAELVARFTVDTFVGSVYDVARNMNLAVDGELGAANLGIATT